MEIIKNVLTALLAAFLGGYFGAWFQHNFQNRKVNKVRKIAIKALDVFCRYVKQGQTFDKAASKFNNSLDVVEKRAGQKTIISSSSFQRALPMVLLSIQKQPSSNTSVITSIIQRLMEVFLFSMILSVSIGRFQQSMPISRRKIRSMRC